MNKSNQQTTSTKKPYKAPVVAEHGSLQSKTLSGAGLPPGGDGVGSS